MKPLPQVPTIPPIKSPRDIDRNTEAITRFLTLLAKTLEGRLQLDEFTVATLPSASEPGQVIYVNNESGGAVPAFSDGTNWRRVTDRAVVS